MQWHLLVPVNTATGSSACSAHCVRIVIQIPYAAHKHTHRYLLAHIFDGPSDNRKSLHEVTHSLNTADTAYLDAARRGLGPAASAAAAKRPPANAAAHGGAMTGSHNSGKLGKQGSTGKHSGGTAGGSGAGEVLSVSTAEASERAARMRARAEATLAILMRRGAAIGAATAAAATASGAALGGSSDTGRNSGLFGNEASLKRPPGVAGAGVGSGSPAKVLGTAFYSAAAAAATGGTSNPRSAVSDWFYALAAIMFKAQQGVPGQGLGLKELLRKYDSDGDGYLDAVSVVQGGRRGATIELFQSA
jgi:hypothetical protein